MAKCLNYESEIQQGLAIESWHVSQSVDAFTGAEDYDITISGSLTLTGSAYLTPSKILATGQEYVLTYNNTTGQIFKATTASLVDRSDDAFTVYRTGSTNNNITPNYFGTFDNTGVSSAIASGNNNKINSNCSFIGGGTLNTASSSCNFIGGGGNNSIGLCRFGSVIVGGYNNNTTSGYYPGPNFHSTFLGGGCNNCISGYGFVIFRRWYQ